MSMMTNERVFLHINFLVNLFNSLRHDDRINDNNDSMIGLPDKTTLVAPHSFICRLKCSGFDLNFRKSRKLQFGALEVTITGDHKGNFIVIESFSFPQDVSQCGNETTLATSLVFEIVLRVRFGQVH